MKLPWEPLSQTEDVESLQADVMRFLAIFGLCLAAIFSLVREAEYERPAQIRQQPDATAVEASPPPAEPPMAAAPDESLSVPPAPVREPEPADSNPPGESEEGFTLQFESSAVMQALMGRGAIKVYARTGDSYRLLDGKGRVQRAPPPASYYSMDPTTLPPSITEAVAEMDVLEGAEWVVTLPTSTANEIRRIVESHEHGVLMIGADTGVRRYENAPR